MLTEEKEKKRMMNLIEICVAFVILMNIFSYKAAFECQSYESVEECYENYYETRRHSLEIYPLERRKEKDNHMIIVNSTIAEFAECTELFFFYCIGKG